MELHSIPVSDDSDNYVGFDYDYCLWIRAELNSVIFVVAVDAAADAVIDAAAVD